MKDRIVSRVVRAWEAVQPHATVNGARIPLRRDNVDLLGWRRNWKTEIICTALSRHPGLFLDVGANVGQTLIDYLSCTDRHGYIGFEPNPRCVERIEAIIDSSRLSDCAVVTTGLAEKSGILRLFRTSDKVDACATMIADLRPGMEVKAEYVPVCRFDDIAPDLIGDRPISLVKIDVEGGEGGVIAGMADTIRRKRPLIVCEVLTRYFVGSAEEHAGRCRSLMSLIRSLDYAVWRVEKDRHEGNLTGYSPVDAFPEEIHTYENQHQCDYVFVPPGHAWSASK